MVGHTGNLEATVEAMAVIDECMAELMAAESAFSAAEGPRIKVSVSKIARSIETPTE